MQGRNQRDLMTTPLGEEPGARLIGYDKEIECFPESDGSYWINKSRREIK